MSAFLKTIFGSRSGGGTPITDEKIEVNSIPIGMPFPQWFESDASAVVTKYPSRFVKLSKNLEGAYNSGKLGVSSAITTNETTFYIATITDVASPLNGQSVTLINSTENTTGGVSSNPSFLAAAETPQVRRVNRFQAHRVLLANSNGGAPLGNLLGGSETGWYYTVTPTSSLAVADRGLIDGDGVNGDPRMGKFTEPTTATAVYYMRIK